MDLDSSVRTHMYEKRLIGKQLKVNWSTVPEQENIVEEFDSKWTTYDP